MSLARLIRSAVMRRFADPVRREARRQAAERARQRTGAGHEVLYFHQVDDPYSQLAAQALAPLLARYAVQLRVLPVAAPTPVAIHEQALWAQWALREAAAIAPYYGLRFVSPAPSNGPAALDLARRLALAAAAEASLAAHWLPRISVALGDGQAALEALARQLPPVPAAQAEAALAANFQRRHRLGHYLGAMFHYAGEWYWGIDRLHYLERRLDGLGARRPDALAGPSVSLQRPGAAPAVPGRRLRLEFFPSLRSPYTHIAYDRVAELARRHPVDLVLRPVLPMMMRGVKADRRKGQYILFDTAREAERLGVPFGNIWDPFGEPVRRAYSLFPWARDRGRGFEYLQAYSQGVWSERLNAYAPSGLRQVVERAGLPWHEAEPLLDRRDWEDEMESNVQAMIAAGSWGVPTLRLPAADGEPEFTVWGQDRIWLIEEEIQRRLGAPDPSCSGT